MMPVNRPVGVRAGLAAAVVVGLSAPLSALPAHAEAEESVRDVPAEVRSDAVPASDPHDSLDTSEDSE
ncbi:hypothetical protein [Nesterenkonia suensis]